MIFVQSYLCLAKIGLKELTSRNYARKTSFEYSFCYENKWLLISVIYNIKHAIEIVVKSLGVSIDKQYLKSHDLNALISDLKVKVPQIKKQDKINELAIIVNKYYKCEFWNKKIITTGSVFDLQNDVFRYPDNTVSFVVDLQAFETIGYKEIKELLEDIEKLERLLGIIDSQIEKAKNPKLDEQREKDGEKLVEDAIKATLKDYDEK